MISLLLAWLFLAGCDVQEKVVVAKQNYTPMPQLPEETAPPALPQQEHDSDLEPVSGNTSPLIELSEFQREKQYGTLLNFSTLQYDDCHRTEDRLQADLESVRESYEHLDERIEEAYHDLRDELTKDDDLRASDPSPAVIARQKEAVKDAEERYERKKREKRDAERQETQLLDTLDQLGVECVKLEVRGKKE